MAAYYDSWDDYKSAFKKYGCKAGKCNVEENHFKKASINYQAIQSFIDYKDSDLEITTGAGSLRKVRNAFPIVSVEGVADNQKRFQALMKEQGCLDPTCLLLCCLPFSTVKKK